MAKNTLVGNRQLTKKEELLLKAQKVARIGYWEVDLIKNTVYWSDITKEIHEVPMSFVPNLEEGINFYKEGEHREKITELVNKAIATGEPWDTELILVTKKGSEVWVNAKGEAEHKNGKPTRLFGTFQDIDEKRRNQIKLDEASERLSLATSNARIGIWDFDVVNNILIWDDNMFNIYGLEKSNFRRAYEAWETCVHPDDKERGQAEVEMALSGKKDFDSEFKIIRPNGEVRYIKASAIVERNKKGNPLKMTGINWDITDLKLTQLQLQRQEESFVGAFENSSIGMALVGLDGKWKQVNKSVSESLGYTQDQLLKLTFQDITHPNDLEKDLDLLHELINGKRDTYQIEKRYFHKKGHIVYVLLTVTGVYNIDGSLSHFISQIVDISSRVEAEKEQEKLHKVTLEQNKNLLNFAHIVSHNLRSHTTNMTMLVGFLQNEKDETEIANIKRMLNSASNGLNETVDYLNEIVQIKMAAATKMKPLSLTKAVHKIQNDLSALIKKHEATIRVDVHDDHIVKAVPAYLDSIILNLFTNALKYASPDRKPLLKVKSTITGNFIAVLFEDNGLGIDLNQHGDKIFGMFKTFHRNKDSKGIGLFITKNQIESMGGQISVDSEVDKGTVFTVKFERARELKKKKNERN